MRKFFLLIGLIFTYFSTASASIYVKGSAGVNLIDIPSKDWISVDVDPGYYLGVALGYKWMCLFRLEGELSYRNNRLDSAQAFDLPVRLDKNVQTWTGFGNVFLDLPRFQFFAPYIGGGIGYHHTRGNFEFDYLDEGGLLFVLAERTVQKGVVYQAIGGLAVPVIPCITAAVDYRYLYMPHGDDNQTVAFSLIGCF